MFMQHERRNCYFSGTLEQTPTGLTVRIPELQSRIFFNVDNVGLANSLSFTDAKCRYLLRVNRKHKKTGSKNFTKMGYYRGY